MNRRPAQYAYPRLPARVLKAALAACSCLLICAGAASAAAPDVTIGSVPPTNAQTGTFSFDADGPALRLQCKLDAAAFDDCVSPVPLSGLTVGPHSFSVRAIGLDNSVGTPATYNWTIDITKPAVPTVVTPPDNLLTNNAAPTFSGTAEPFAYVPVFDGSTQIANPQASVDGSWAFTPAAALTDGTHLWRVRAVDAAGNRSDFTALRSLRIDTQAPAAPVIVNPADAAKVTTRTPSFSGTAEGQATISVSEGGTPLCATTADSAGAWNCASTIQLLDGAHQVDVIARDGASNEGPSVQRSFELDATAPDAPSVMEPMDGIATAATSITVVGAAAPNAAIKVLIGTNEVADATADIDGIWSHTFSDIAEGVYAFGAKEVDSFGNRSVISNIVNVRVDRTAPTVTVNTHPPTRTNQTNAAFTISSGEPNVDFECELDSSGWLPCVAAQSYSGLGAATHSFKARATDRAGNVGNESVAFNWTIDLEPPLAPVIDSPVDGATVTTARPSFTGHAEERASVEMFVGAASLGTAPANPTTGAWALTPGNALAQGPLAVKARAIDEAGNVGPFSPTRTLTVDSIAPITTIQNAPTTPTNANTVSVVLNADDPLATFSCSLDAAAFVACSSPFTTPTLSEGSHTLLVRAKDVVGNTEAPAKSVTFLVDRTEPVGQSSQIAGSAGSDGVPQFLIASSEPGATARCKLDNAAFVNCSGQFKPVASAGIHALTIRYSDAAGNTSDQVLVFNVVPVVTPPTPPTPPPADNYEEPTPPPAAVCKVLGADGLTSGRLKVVTASGAGRDMKLSLSSGAAAVVRVDAAAGVTSLASAPFMVKSGTTKLKVRLKRAPAAGAKIALAVRFYSVKREYGTAGLSLVANSSGLRRASGAQSTLDTACPVAAGPSAGAKFTATSAAAGARSFLLSSKAKRAGLIAIKVYRAGAAAPVVDQVFAVGAGKQKVKIKLLGRAKLAAGGYKFTFDALGAGGLQSSGRGAFVAR
ncbi:MAG: Ig-like domain-containing protein [Solirubrobacterales bacterium]